MLTVSLVFSEQQTQHARCLGTSGPSGPRRVQTPLPSPRCCSEPPVEFHTFASRCFTSWEAALHQQPHGRRLERRQRQLPPWPGPNTLAEPEAKRKVGPSPISGVRHSSKKVCSKASGPSFKHSSRALRNFSVCLGRLLGFLPDREHGLLRFNVPLFGATLNAHAHFVCDRGPTLLMAELAGGIMGRLRQEKYVRAMKPQWAKMSN